MVDFTKLMDFPVSITFDKGIFVHSQSSNFTAQNAILSETSLFYVFIGEFHDIGPGTQDLLDNTSRSYECVSVHRIYK